MFQLRHLRCFNSRPSEISLTGERSFLCGVQALQHCKIRHRGHQSLHKNVQHGGSPLTEVSHEGLFPIKWKCLLHGKRSLHQHMLTPDQTRVWPIPAVILAQCLALGQLRGWLVAAKRCSNARVMRQPSSKNHQNDTPSHNDNYFDHDSPAAWLPFC